VQDIERARAIDQLAQRGLGCDSLVVELGERGMSLLELGNDRDTERAGLLDGVDEVRIAEPSLGDVEHHVNGERIEIHGLVRVASVAGVDNAGSGL
jgi:hypothetical protein